MRSSFLGVTYAMLFKATDGFSSANLIGAGSHGSIYKGLLDCIETLVAIKILKLQQKRSFESFIAECKALGRIQHRNIIKILTLCSSTDFRGNDFKALVFQYMANGSLEMWLHQDENEKLKSLNHLQRLNVAIDVAYALDFLHHHCEAPIIHCDLKPGNVLLDDDMVAHVGDFGLARILSNDVVSSSRTQSSMLEMKGSIGYIAPVPEHGIFQNPSAISILGNAKLCGGIPKLKLPKCPKQGFKKQEKPFSRRVIIIIVAAAILFLFILLCFLAIPSKKLRGKLASKSSMRKGYLQVTYGELFKATDGFSSANLIGEGSYSLVYRGIIDRMERIVAIKILNLLQRRASKSFIAECRALSSICHRNIIRVLTVCSSIDFSGNDFKALILEYMSNGSLDSWLHQNANEYHQLRFVSLIQRLNVAIDIACALDYLHHHCPTTILHCDLKPSNILLDDDMVAHVGDFGIARILSDDINDSRTQTNSLAIRGSIGYVAPEYGMGANPSTYGDVYSYGILLLEMLTGKRPSDDMFKNNLNLHQFAKMALPERVMEIIDHQLLSHENEVIRQTRALDYLHNHYQAPIVHCDLKPANVLLDDDMVAHVDDFGLAKILSEDFSYSQSQTNSLAIKGTVRYSAPANTYYMGRIVAIKILNLQQRRASKCFIAECRALSSICHRNIVRVLTVCSSIDFSGNDFKALILEYMSNGSLDTWLHQDANEYQQLRFVSLIQRLNVAIDIACALDYLHHHCPTTILHCDLKPSNVLLDDDMVAHVGDFGLARILSDDINDSRTQTNSLTIRGSIGYVAPGNTFIL
ncbi:hypothetical protein AAC387_Pa04g0929 [Persea americana]